MLAKVRHMVDSVRVIHKIPEASSTKTRGQAHVKQVEAAPLSLRGRVERGEPLPEADVRDASGKKRRVSEEQEEKEKVLRAVARFVAFELKAELVVELLETLKPRCAR